ncbi:multidrug and toxin extrusion protein 2-like [Tubulanus polymorphus]|uniref:multidrug and toxin extrusion protein 2-like n=1 Tax=Tubulanus polymorphus TaxID=672921 RepID=UPI003DA56715
MKADLLREELRFFIVTSWPIVVIPVLTDLPILACTIIVAQSDLISQAAFSLVCSFFGVVYALGMGMSTGIEGLFSQAFGAKNYRYLRLLLQRGLLILICSGLLLLPLNFTADKIFILFGQNATVAEEAGRMLMVMSPDNIFVFANDILTRFLMSQDIVLPVVIVTLVNNVITAVICYVTVIVLRLASLGAAISLLVSFFIGAVSMAVGSSLVNKDTIALYRINTDIFRNLWEVASMAIGSTVSTLSVDIALTIGVFLTGTFGVVELVVLSVTLQVFLFNLNIFWGISEACCMRVGFLLSSRDGRAAKRALFFYQVIALMVAAVFGVLICSLHAVLARGFASDRAVEAKLKFTLLYIGATLPLFAVDVIFNAAIRGCAKITLISITCFSSLTIGTSLGLILLYFTRLGAMSIIIGYQSSCVLNAVIFVPYALFVLDWDEQSKLARHRTADDLKLIHDGTGNGELDYSTFDLTPTATSRRDSSSKIENESETLK